jgi:hypothetical protein
MKGRGQGWRHSSSRSRRTASLAGFFDLSHVLDGPLRYGASVRFDTMPSNPMRQACSNTVGPSPIRCSVNRMERRLAQGGQLCVPKTLSGLMT